MREISLEELDKVRKSGYRPGVVCCFVHGRKLLLFYKRDYGIWLLPQGGIENDESVKEAYKREITEDVGSDLLSKCENVLTYIGEGDIEFNPNSKGIRDLKTDAGEHVSMKGKKYFFFVINVNDPVFDIKNSEFNEYVWANYEQALFLFGKNYQVNKKKLTLNALEQLKSKGLVE
ncbi:NUDIX domain-containing protein [Patescibacteria group bacterium]|nr:NUDIX domain-containing protein [Patescibacteria group bacterium]